MTYKKILVLGALGLFGVFVVISMVTHENSNSHIDTTATAETIASEYGVDTFKETP